MRLEALQPDATVRGILPDALVTVVSVAWHGSDALTLVYRAPNGRVADEILYRHDESRLEIVEAGRPWSFDGDGALFRLVSEAHRIRLAHLFDPVLAVHTSLVDPYRSVVDQLLAEGVWNAVVIWRELQAKGYRGGISILRDYLHPKRALRPGRATVRFETEPGRQLQSDWATHRTMIAGQATAVHFVVNTLSFSRRFHFWCTGTEDAEHTYEGLVRAFEWFGGAPGEVLADASRWVPSLTPPVPDAHHRGLVGPGRLRLPRWWIEMLKVARRVSWARPTPFLRVDMFSSVDGPVIGELTPTPGGPHYGMWRFKPWFDHELGQGWSKAARRLDRHQHRRSSA